MARSEETVEIDDVEYQGQTAEARLFLTASGEEVWVPKACSEWDGEILTLPERMALDKGLI